tara:strand:+ start:22738 stop:22968 length:231 start_codon:yes stop_codon:yes gene_type:complete
MMSEKNKEDRVRLVEQLNDLANSWDNKDAADPDADASVPQKPADDVPAEGAGLSAARKRAIAKYLAQQSQSQQIDD